MGIGGGGGGLSAQQMTQLQAMLKATKVPPTSLPANLLNVPGAPTAVSTSSLASDARMQLMKRQGYKATVKSSPLGDAGFGTSLLKPSTPLAYGG